MIEIGLKLISVHGETDQYKINSFDRLHIHWAQMCLIVNFVFMLFGSSL